MRYFTFDRLDMMEVRTAFDSALPFPHAVLTNVISIPPESDLIDYPDKDWPCWSRFTDKYQRNKHTCSDITALPHTLQAMIDELHAPPFLSFLEAVTGIEKLIPDPYLKGGPPPSGPGGVLVPHTDFHNYGELDLYRQLNVLVYLNPGWDESRGGCLELFEDR